MRMDKALKRQMNELEERERQRQRAREEKRRGQQSE
jgi:hypothetical protein